MSFISNSTRSSSSSRRAQRSGSSSGSTSTHNTPRQHIELHEYIQVVSAIYYLIYFSNQEEVMNPFPVEVLLVAISSMLTMNLSS